MDKIQNLYDRLSLLVWNSPQFDEPLQVTESLSGNGIVIHGFISSVLIREMLDEFDNVYQSPTQNGLKVFE